MRTSAERVLTETTQPDGALQTFFLGNGPIGHLEGSDAPLFFHRAQLIKGSLALKQGLHWSDYAWLNKAEILDQTGDAPLQELLQKML